MISATSSISRTTARQRWPCPNEQLSFTMWKGIAMPGLKQARAYGNNEVAYIAWEVDGPIPGCLGFEVTRIYLNDDDTVAMRNGVPDRVACASWVAFKGQKNPHWLPQHTGIWPVQKLSWRDLTLRKKRDGLKR